jgi:hypothetical protein
MGDIAATNSVDIRTLVITLFADAVRWRDSNITQTMVGGVTYQNKTQI